MSHLLPCLDTCQLFFFFYALFWGLLVWLGGRALKYNNVLLWSFEITSTSIPIGLNLFCTDILSFNTFKLSSAKILCKAVCPCLLEWQTTWFFVVTHWHPAHHPSTAAGSWTAWAHVEGASQDKQPLALSIHYFQIWWESGARKERYLMQNLHFSAPAVSAGTQTISFQKEMQPGLPHEGNSCPVSQGTGSQALFRGRNALVASAYVSSRLLHSFPQCPCPHLSHLQQPQLCVQEESSWLLPMTSRGKAGEIGFAGEFFEAWGCVIVFLCALFSNALHIRGVPQFGDPWPCGTC